MEVQEHFASGCAGMQLRVGQAGVAPGGRDCLSLSALSLSSTHRVYRNRVHRTLNLVWLPFFLMRTDLASDRRAVNRNCLISVI